MCVLSLKVTVSTAQFIAGPWGRHWMVRREVWGQGFGRWLSSLIAWGHSKTRLLLPL